MSALADVKAVLVPGVVVDVTNHYITRPDHPCFGTNRRTILSANSASFTLSNEGGDPPTSRIPWPKAADVSIDGAGRVHLAGHPKPGDPFLTLVLADEEEAYPEAESFDHQPVDREAQGLAVRREAVEQDAYRRGGVA